MSPITMPSARKSSSLSCSRCSMPLSQTSNMDEAFPFGFFGARRLVSSRHEHMLPFGEEFRLIGERGGGLVGRLAREIDVGLLRPSDDLRIAERFPECVGES